MIDLSVVIPNRNAGIGANFLNKTIRDLLDKSVTNIEIVVNVDEAWPQTVLQDKRITYVHPSSPVGLRQSVNNCVAVARGKYIMKIDDHCLVGPRFDQILIENHASDRWIQIPRRYSLDAENWCINDTRPFRDYMYLDFPLKGKAHDNGMHGVEWFDRQNERMDPKYDIDETPSLQGSCYFMSKNHFDNFLHGLDQTNYGHFAQESQEISLKTWLGGGKMIVNKKTFYAHLHKGKTYGRMYKLDNTDHVRGAEWSAEHWLNDREPNMIHKFEWFIDEKFPNMPGWPKDWKEQIRQMGWTN